MSLLLIDGVDHYPNSLSQNFATNGPWNIYDDVQLYTDGYTGFEARYPGQNMIRTSGLNGYVQKSFTQEQTIVAACAFKYITDTDTRRELIVFYDNAGASAPVVGTVKVNPFNGKVSYTDSSGTNTIEADEGATQFLSADVWYFIEAKITAGVGGGVQININGVTWLNTTADNTAPAGGIGIVRFEGPTGNCMFTDFYIDNSTMHGDVRVITLVPDADNAAVEWIKGGTASDCTDKNKCYLDKLGTSPSDAVDDGYVRINQVASDVYGMSDLPTGTWQVKGVMLAARALKESSGSPTLGLSVNSGASSTGSVIPDIKSQVGSLHDFADDAADPWTTANVNAMVLTMSYE